MGLPFSTEPRQWSGKNLQGTTLMEVRQHLASISLQQQATPQIGDPNADLSHQTSDRITDDLEGKTDNNATSRDEVPDHAPAGEKN